MVETKRLLVAYSFKYTADAKRQGDEHGNQNHVQGVHDVGKDADGIFEIA
jgi:hypothetical protein